MEWRVLRNANRDAEREHLNKILKDMGEKILGRPPGSSTDVKIIRETITYVPAAHTHSLSDIEQSGATLDQVPSWDGTAWVPKTIASSISSGLYTPAVSSLVNIDSITMREARYTKVGEVVSVAGEFDIIPTGGGTTEFEADLPIAADLVSPWQLSGNGSEGTTHDMRIRGNDTTDKAKFLWESHGPSNHTFTYIFNYGISELSISGSLFNGAVGIPYSSSLTGTAGVPPYTWSLVSAPSWMTINPSTGVITGTPDATFSSTITVRLTDSLGDFVEATPSLTIGTLWTLASLSPSIHVSPDSAIVSSGGNVSEWRDLANPSNAIIQPNSARCPLIIASALNGRRGIRFNGTLSTAGQTMYHGAGVTDDAKLKNVSKAWAVVVYKKTSADPSPQGRTIFRVLNNAGTQVRIWMGAGAGSAGNQNNPFAAFGANDAGGQVVARIPGQPVLDWHIMLAYADYANSTGYFWQNGTKTNTVTIPGSSATSNTEPLGGGAQIASGLTNDPVPADTENADITLMELAIRGGGSGLADTDIDKVFGSLHWQYGLQANLPSGHPYKLEPPLA